MVRKSAAYGSVLLCVYPDIDTLRYCDEDDDESSREGIYKMFSDDGMDQSDHGIHEDNENECGHLAEEMNLDADADWSEILDNQPIILNDRMMTDAMQSPHIQSEHSYSLTLSDEMPQSPFGMAHIKLEDYSKDMETECFPAVSMTSATGQSEFSEEDVLIKQEPPSPPPRVPSPSQSAATISSLLGAPSSLLGAPSSPMHPQSLLKQPTIVLATRPQLQHQNPALAPGAPFGLPYDQQLLYPKVSVKMEPQLSTSGFPLPPTPPSCNGSDSDGSLSPVHSVRRPTPPPVPHGSGTSSSSGSASSSRKAHAKVLLSVTSTKHTNNSQTSLISSQPKGATGILLLTEEEKRTLLAEGYPIPQRLPLTKAEERSLKKIRRKIKNKISAQESRRKKKEYMDALEKKVEVLASENNEYKKKLESLEGSNKSLLSQLQQLQAILAEVPPHRRSRNVGTQTYQALSPRHNESNRSSRTEDVDITDAKGR